MYGTLLAGHSLSSCAANRILKKVDCELCSFPDFTFRFNVSVVNADDLSGHGKTDSHAVIGSIACLIEPFKYVREMFFCNYTIR